MLMTLDHAFLDDIVAHPDDDTPRLVYADWLEENSNPDRADFIRSQCELARLPEDDLRRFALEDRANELLLEHEPEWAGPFAGITLHRRYARGFLDSLRMPVGLFVSRCEDLYRLGPVESVSLTEAAMAMRGLARCPRLANVRQLSLVQQNLTDPALDALLDSDHLGELRSLSLGGNRLSLYAMGALRRKLGNSGLVELDLGTYSDGYNPIDDDGLRELVGGRWPKLAMLRLMNTQIGSQGLIALMRSNLFGRLTHLDLGHNQFGPVVAEELAGSVVPSRLLSLNLHGCTIGNLGAEVLAGWPGLAGLRHLELGFCSIGRRGLTALARSPYLAGLEELHLGGNESRGPESDGEGLAGLIRSPQLASLKRLRLYHCWLGDNEIEALAGAEHLSRVRMLSLGANRLGKKRLRILRDAPFQRSLIDLDVSDARLHAAGLRELMRWPCLPRLRRLALDENQIGDAGLDVLRSWPESNRLIALVLSDNEIGSAGAGLLAWLPQFARLTTLELSNNQIGLEGAKALAASPYLHRLEKLSLRYNNLNDEAQAMLRRRFGPRVVL